MDRRKFLKTVTVAVSGAAGVQAAESQALIPSMADGLCWSRSEHPYCFGVQRKYEMAICLFDEMQFIGAWVHVYYRTPVERWEGRRGRKLVATHNELDLSEGSVEIGRLIGLDSEFTKMLERFGDVTKCEHTTMDIVEDAKLRQNGPTTLKTVVLQSVGMITQSQHMIVAENVKLCYASPPSFR